MLRRASIAALLLAAFAAGGAHAASCATAEYDASMQQMMREMHIPYTGQTDTDFARGMIPHHAAAIRTAETVLRFGKADETIAHLARWIIISQRSEIAQMQRWLDTRGMDAPSTTSQEAASQPASQEFVADMNVMHQGMDIVYSNDAEHDFVCGMIPHHQGAIAMATTELRHGQWPEMQLLAKNIVRSQKSDIAKMQGWLEKRGLSCQTKQPSANAHGHH